MRSTSVLLAGSAPLACRDLSNRGPSITVVKLSSPGVIPTSIAASDALKTVAPAGF